MTVEPYAFYFMGRNSSIKFTGITAAPSTLTGVGANSDKNYYYNSQNYVEEKVYKPESGVCIIIISLLIQLLKQRNYIYVYGIMNN